MSDERARIDRWLWAARFYKTRGLAAEAVKGGRVSVNDTRAKPAKEVGPGDRIEVSDGPVSREVVVRAVAVRRGPASVAAELYEETADSVARRERHAAERRAAPPLGADRAGRPTKRDRRLIESVRARGSRPRL